MAAHDSFARFGPSGYVRSIEGEGPCLLRFGKPSVRVSFSLLDEFFHKIRIKQEPAQ
jgi:hypothetical protein